MIHYGSGRSTWGQSHAILPCCDMWSCSLENASDQSATNVIGHHLVITSEILGGKISCCVSVMEASTLFFHRAVERCAKNRLVNTSIHGPARRVIAHSGLWIEEYERIACWVYGWQVEFCNASVRVEVKVDYGCPRGWRGCLFVLSVSAPKAVLESTYPSKCVGGHMMFCMLMSSHIDQGKTCL